MAKTTNVLSQKTIEHIAALSNPHMRAINDAVTAAYPDHPDAMYTVALTFQLVTLLSALDPVDRSAAVELINEFLALSSLGYRLTALS